MKKILFVFMLVFAVSYGLFSQAQPAFQKKVDTAMRVWEGDYYIFRFHQYRADLRGETIRTSSSGTTSANNANTSRGNARGYTMEEIEAMRAARLQQTTPSQIYQENVVVVERPYWITNTTFSGDLIDLAIKAYEAALVLEPSGTWQITDRERKNSNNLQVIETHRRQIVRARGNSQNDPYAVHSFSSTTRSNSSSSQNNNPDDRWLNPPSGGVQAKLKIAQDLKENWLVEGPPLQQQRNNAQQVREQGREAFVDATVHLINGRYAEAISDYEIAISSGGLNNNQKSEAERLLKEAQDIQTTLNVLNNPKDDDFNVKQNANNTITITGFKLSTGERRIRFEGRDYDIKIAIPELKIPARLFGLPVTIIADEEHVPFKGINGAFKEKAINSVVIPDSVTLIGAEAFKKTGLTKVTLGRGVKTIFINAFCENPNLTEITIPNSVTAIWDGAFYNCGLTRITFGNGLQVIRSEAFANNKLTSVTLPPGLKGIGINAFRNNQIESVTIPSGITEIGDYVFDRNPITRATLPANISNDNMLYNYGFEESLVNFYASQKRAAGTYVKNGPVWTKQ